MTPAALQVSRLTRRFGKTVAVDNLSLTLDGPQVACLLGPNGAGKSTLMRLVTGFLPADTGTIAIAGHDLATAPAAAHAALGYLPENAPTFPRMRVAEALAFCADMRGIPRRERADAIERALGLCELHEVASRLCDQLSKGFRHRLGLALAILHRPPLLILDEPTDGLDPAQKETARKLIRRLGEESAVLVSTHILDEVPDICDRVIILHQGKIVSDTPVPQNLPELFFQATK